MSASVRNDVRQDAATSLAGRLRRMPKRYFLLALLVPLLVVLWLPLLTGKKNAAKTQPVANPAATPTATPAAPGVEGATRPADGNPVADAEAAQARIEELMAPFVPRWTAADAGNPFRAAEVAPAETLDGAARELTPTTIVLSGDTPPIAIIGGQPYRPGDLIGGRTVLAIEERRVIFRDGNKTYAVPLPETSLRGDHD